MIGFSIIVCCFNSGNELYNTLRNLDSIIVPSNCKLEILIIDNNSTDNTLDIVNSFIAKAKKLTFKVFSETQVGKKYALIKGFENAAYDYILICDDDNILFDNYLLVASEVIQKDSNIGFIGGIGIINVDISLPDWYYKFEGCYACGKQNDISGYITNTEKYIWGAGMIFKKKIWLDIKKRGFNNFFTGRSNESVLMAGEDSELCIIGEHLGYELYFEEELKYYHNIKSKRLTWKHLVELNIGFARSQVYFEIYKKIFSSEIANATILQKLFFSNFKCFFYGFPKLNWFKIFIITFVLKREGYVFGIEKLKCFYRMKETLRTIKKIKQIRNQINLIK